MTMNQNDFAVSPDFRAWALGFACGVMSGALLGVLFAPARGREMRERIGGAARQGRDRASGVITENREAVVRQKERVEALVDEARKQVGHMTGEVAAAMRDAKSTFERAKAEITGR
jgi:gas vesicle protein